MPGVRVTPGAPFHVARTSAPNHQVTARAHVETDALRPVSKWGKRGVLRPGSPPQRPPQSVRCPFTHWTTVVAFLAGAAYAAGVRLSFVTLGTVPDSRRMGTFSERGTFVLGSARLPPSRAMTTMMDRRVFLGTLAGGLLAAPLAAQAQQPGPKPRVGLLLTGSPLDKAQTRELEAFTKKLAQLGWVDGETLTVKTRWAGTPDRLPALAAEVVGTGVDVLVTPGPAATDAARRTTSAIPTLMIAGTDPRMIGAASLARPGGNLTGLTIGQPEVHGKRLELLKEALPGVRRVAALWDVMGYETGPGFAMLGATAKSLGLELQQVDATGHGGYERAFNAAARGGAGAVLLLESPRTVVHRAYIAQLAVKRRLPVMSQFSRLVEVGGLMSYGPELSDLFARAAIYVDKILKGAKSADLPIEQPTKFELVINLKTAKALGLTIPPSLLQRADQVIE